MHRANASVLIALGLLACAGNRQRAALGWSLGGEAHVFVADDHFAQDFYRELTGTGRLQDTLQHRPLVALESRAVRAATVLSARGAAPARLTLVRFHAPGTCGATAIVTELVLAFPPGSGGPSGRSTPPSHVSVVALLDASPLARDVAGGPRGGPLPHGQALDLVTRVARRAQTRGPLLEPFTLDPDKSADAGEVVALSRGRYAVGFRGRFLTNDGDTLLVTGVAVTDTGAHNLRWVVRPLRSRLTNGMASSASGATRYSLRGAVADASGGTLLLLDEIADVEPRNSRATAVDAETGHVMAAQPLALRCP